MSQKKAKSRNIRNVLATPFNIKWSESNPEGVASLQRALEGLLPLAKLEKKSLKLCSKGESEEKIPHGPPSGKKHNNIFRTYLALGFNSVIRGLERNELCCVLLARDISPPMIPRVVCNYCSNYCIPVMTVPELKTTTKSTLGIPTMVLGFKKIAGSTENSFFPIYEIVSQNRSILETPFTVKQTTDIISSDKKDKDHLKHEMSCVSSTSSKNFYLYRESRNKRVFRPGMEVSSEVNSQIQPKHGMDGDFISFSKSDSSSLELQLVNRKIPKTDKSESEDDSDCDSLDEDNIFFVDDKPDQMLLEVDSSINKDHGSAAGTDILRLDGKSIQNKEIENSSPKRVKKMSERYFSNNVNEDGKPNKLKSKEKKILKQKAKLLQKTVREETREKFSSSTYNPMTVKTIISNPKKIKRKKK